MTLPAELDVSAEYEAERGYITTRNCVLFVILLSLAVYASSIFNLFAYDDVAVIRDDARVHALDAKHLSTILNTTYWNSEAQGIYRPLVTTSFAVDWRVATNHPGWYHFVNMIWNASACALVFLVLAELFPLLPAVAGATLFAVHPVHVEAVANVVGRAECMAATFMLAAALLWLRHPYDREHRSTFFATVPLLFFLALMCKESAIMLPPLLVLLDVGAGRLRRESIVSWTRERVMPLAVLAAPMAAFLVMRSRVVHGFSPLNLDAALEVAPRGLPRILTALKIWPQFLRLFAFPRVLIADYGPRILLPQFAVSPAVAFGALILAALVVGGFVAAWRGNGRTALGLLWIPVAMLPVCNLLFPIGIILAERTLYLPTFALSVAVAGMFTFIATRRADHLKPAWVGFLLVCAAFTARTQIRIPQWRDTSTIFNAMMHDHPDAFRGVWHLARVASDKKDPHRAMSYYAQAIQLWPYRTRLLKEAADFAAHNGDLNFARKITEQGVKVWPRDPDFRRSLAGITLDLGDTANAVIQVNEGLRLMPNDTVLNAMRSALKAKGK